MLKFKLIAYNIFWFLLFCFCLYATSQEHKISLWIYIVSFIFYILFAWFVSSAWLLEKEEKAKQAKAASLAVATTDDDEELDTVFDDSEEAAYLQLFGGQGVISKAEFETAWRNDGDAIDFIDKNYSQFSREPLAQMYLFKRLMRYDMSDSDELLEKDLLLIKKLISQERPNLGEFVPVFFDDLYHVAEGDTFWDGYFGELSIEIIQWLEGNPYRYALYKFWNETCGVDTYSEGEITEEVFDGYHSELSSIYKAAKGDYRLAKKKLAELEPDSLEYTLYEKLQKHAGKHLEYYNIS